MGKPVVDGRFDQIGCEESKRDSHVDLSRATPFTLGRHSMLDWPPTVPSKKTARMGDKQSRRRLGAELCCKLKIKMENETEPYLSFSMLRSES
jgi:hypothetical protein